MRTSVHFRQTILVIFGLAPALAFAQTNTEKIKAKWIVEKMETEKNTPQAVKAGQELQGYCLTFGEGELLISKRTATGDSVIKRGPYAVTGNALRFGKDQAQILSLSGNDLTVKVPGQYILYLKKL